MEQKPLDTRIRIPKGICISEPEHSGPVVENCTCHTICSHEQPASYDSWSYLFIHHTKVKHFAERMELDGITCFIHKSVKYLRKKESRGIMAVETPTISGLIFMQDTPHNLQTYLDKNFPGYHLVNDCSTGRPAVIPHRVMEPFMRILETSPERIRFLLHPFRYYAARNIKLRITSGFLAGIEGYVVRIDRDRRLVMDVGGMSVAISGVHCEKFEVVG